jgi:HAE1 family hydrophobic/amphiphilic exporter-1
VLSDFFITRPRFAFVIVLVITLAGAIALQVLPISEYPNITPPQVQVTASYPGANAEVVKQSVATPIEEQVNGVDQQQ